MSDSLPPPPLHDVLDAYGIKAESIEAIPSANNEIYRIVAPDATHALRIHRPGGRSDTEILSEMRFLEAVYDKGLPVVPRPRRTDDDSYIVYIGDGDTRRAVTLLGWLPGRVLRPGSGAGAATLRRIGVALAQLHEVSATLSLSDFPASSLAPSLLIPPYPEHVADADHRRLIEAVITRSETLLASVPMAPDHRGLIHHDVVFSNCIHSGRQMGLIDFDDCGWAPYLQDLGPMLSNLSGVRGEAHLRESFLAGYASVRRLPSSDPFVLDSMIALRHAWATAWAYGRGAVGDFAPDHVEKIAAHRMGEALRLLDPS
jgi:Ser/Thr protein kinase RdoA (MazF antagonist)